jgi:tetratricopeptide (TPR) repeat protein
MTRGAPAYPSDRNCGYCKAEFFVTSIAYLSRFDKNGLSKYLLHFKRLTQQNPRDGEGFLGLGLCYLQSGLFSLAQQCFAYAIAVASELPQPYYYQALAKVAGRRLMAMSLDEIREIEQYVATAAQLDGDSPVFKLFLACIKGDYFGDCSIIIVNSCGFKG